MATTAATIMAIWITVIAALAIAIVLLIALRERRRRALAGVEAPVRKDTVPVEMSATIRSYVVPNRWLRSPPGSPKDHPTAAAGHPRFTSAAIELAADTPQPGRRSAWELLRGRTRLGRDADNHVILDDERVSLHHALITVREGVYWLEDLGSTNGTFVGDDRRVMSPHPLRDGDRLRLGGVVLVFRGRS